MISAETLLRSLVGEPLATVRGRSNTVLSVSEGMATVATSRTPEGRTVPVIWLQETLDRLAAGEVLELDPRNVGYRSAFLGAVLRTLPMVDLVDGSPPTVRVDPDYEIRPDVLAEFETRLRMYAELVAAGGPSRVAPAVLRGLGIYGGASGVWNDVRRTRGLGGANSVTVGLLHTGRHYPDDLSDLALLYHYPSTSRPPGRDRAEVEATKAAGRLRLPVFVILQEGSLRTVRRGWVASSDDSDQLFLVEFGPMPVRVMRGDAIDATPFELFEDRDEVFRRTRGRPNQQRFKIQVLQRYGGRCALCDSKVVEWLHAAHLAGEAEQGSSDPRNGLPLCSNHHAAFDRGLISLDPSNSRVYVRKYSAAALGVTRVDLSHLSAQPELEALRYRWARREADGWSAVTTSDPESPLAS